MVGDFIERKGMDDRNIACINRLLQPGAERATRRQAIRRPAAKCEAEISTAGKPDNFRP